MWYLIVIILIIFIIHALSGFQGERYYVSKYNKASGLWIGSIRMYQVWDSHKGEVIKSFENLWDANAYAKHKDKLYFKPKTQR